MPIQLERCTFSDFTFYLRLGVVFCFLSLSHASAQVTDTSLDLNLINKKTAQDEEALKQEVKIKKEKLAIENESKKLARKKSREEKWFKLEYAFDKYLEDNETWPKSTLPKRRLFSKEDLAKKDLIQCVTKILQHHAGGEDAPEIAQKLLLRAMDNNSWLAEDQKINLATKSCKDLSQRLLKVKDARQLNEKINLAINQLPVRNAAENKTKNLISTLFNPPAILKCQIVEYGLEAILFLGATASMDHLQCLMSRGEVINFIGPSLGVNLGFALDLLASKVSSDYNLNVRKFGKHVNPADKGEHTEGASYANAIAISAGVGFSREKDLALKEDAFRIGPSWFNLTLDLGFEFRFFNSKRHWEVLIDQLN